MKNTKTQKSTVVDDVISTIVLVLAVGGLAYILWFVN